jgi:hypothetical protein
MTEEVRRVRAGYKSDVEICEEKIARNPQEEGHVFNRRKVFLFSGRGDELRVRLTDGEKKRTRKRILTHNHPFDGNLEAIGGNRSHLSHSDLKFAHSKQGYNLREIRMVIGNKGQQYERHIFSWRFALPVTSEFIIRMLLVIKEAYDAKKARLWEEHKSALNEATAKALVDHHGKYCDKVIAFLSKNKRWWRYGYRYGTAIYANGRD